MKFFVWLNDRSIHRVGLRQLLQSHPEWFVQCDAEGNEDPRGHYWAVRHEAFVSEGHEEADGYGSTGTARQKIVA